MVVTTRERRSFRRNYLTTFQTEFHHNRQLALRLQIRPYTYPARWFTPVGTLSITIIDVPKFIYTILIYFIYTVCRRDRTPVGMVVDTVDETARGHVPRMAIVHCPAIFARRNSWHGCYRRSWHGQTRSHPTHSHGRSPCSWPAIFARRYCWPSCHCRTQLHQIDQLYSLYWYNS